MSSQTYLCSRGSVYTSKLNPTISVGMFVLFPPLISPITPIIINGAELTKMDIVLPEVYLNGSKVLYSFGPAWGQITISGEILLGSVNLSEAGFLTSVANGLRIVETYFSLFRASNYGSPIILSALRYAKPVKFFLTSYVRGQVNAEFNTIAFKLSGLVIDRTLKGLQGAALELLDDTLTTAVAGAGSVASQGLSGAVAGIL